MVEPGQSQPQGVKQPPALGAGFVPDRLGPGAPGLSSQGSGGSRAAAFAVSPASSITRRHRAGNQPDHSVDVGQPLQIGPDRAPEGSGRPCGRRAATASYGSMCNSRHSAPSVPRASKCAGARPILAKSNSRASSSSDSAARPGRRCRSSRDRTPAPSARCRRRAAAPATACPAAWTGLAAGAHQQREMGEVRAPARPAPGTSRSAPRCW